MRIKPTYRVAEARQCRGQKPLALGARRAGQQNRSRCKAAMACSREARCWETGVPTFHLNPGPMYVI